MEIIVFCTKKQIQNLFDSQATWRDGVMVLPLWLIILWENAREYSRINEYNG